MNKRLLLAFLLQLSLISLHAQVTRVQIINNIPDVSVNEIDVYVNGSLVADNVAFRAGSGFVLLPATTPITVGIAPGTSLALIDTFKSFNITLSPSGDYFMVVNGIKSSSGYSPIKPVSLSLYLNAQPAATVPTNVDLLFLNGSTDAPTHDIRYGVNVLSNDMAYGAYSPGYSNLPGADIKLRMTNSSGSTTIKNVDAPFAGMSFVGQAGLVIVSGFDKPSSNSNGPSLGLWLATTNTGPLTELQSGTPEALARGQFIHNCADTTADTVDIYVDGVKVADDLRFRHATTFMDFIAKTNIDIEVAPRNSSTSADAYYTLPVTLDSAGTYLFVANGIKSVSGYTPAPAFRLSKFNTGREAALTATNTDVVFVNGSTDAGNMTISDFPAATTWFSGISFGNFASGYYSAATANSTLKLSNGSTNSYYLGNFSTQSWLGQAITLVASGFTDSTVNSKGPKLGLWAATAAGGAMTMLPTTTVGINQVNTTKQFKTYPVPAHDVLYIMNSNATTFNAAIIDITGKQIKTIIDTGSKINIADLADGTYLLQLSDTENKQLQTIRFIKQ